MASDTLRQPALAAALERHTPARFTPALAEVYQANFRYVWRCLRSLGVDFATLDDAVQEVFLVVSRKLSDFDGRSELRTWLYAIVLHIARQHRTKAARRARRFVSDSAERFVTETSHVLGDLRADVEHNEQLMLAQRALAALDDAKREVFVLACLEGMSAPEIAEVTGVPLNTVYSRLRVSKQQFEKAASEISEGRTRDDRSSP
jgi:RNA polymerase sigma-70 factor (ECF subfamily)